MSIVSAGLRLAVHAHVHVFRWSEALSQAEPPLKPSPIRSPQQLDVADHPGAQEGMLSEEELQAALWLQAILTLAQCRGIAGLYIEWLPKWVSLLFFIRLLLRSNMDVYVCVWGWVSVWVSGCLGVWGWKWVWVRGSVGVWGVGVWVAVWRCGGVGCVGMCVCVRKSIPPTLATVSRWFLALEGQRDPARWAGDYRSSSECWIGHV